MYEFVKSKFKSGITWEQTRDSIYQRYQVDQKDGYDITSRNLYCNGCFASGINFAASLVSYFYGKGNFKETIKIATLSGWDSDNPASTWGGLLGFIHGKDKIEKIFNKSMSSTYNIHRTRQNFKNNGIDDFRNMSMKGIEIVDNVVKKTGGIVDQINNKWIIKN
jgi:ADP-ribosylglycohydrolase